MADRKQTTYKTAVDKEVSGLVKALRKLNPNKRMYSELSKSSSTPSMSSGSSFVSDSSISKTPAPGPSGSRGSVSKKDESLRKKKEDAEEKELLKKLQKSVENTSKTLDKYVAVRNRKK